MENNLLENIPEKFMDKESGDVRVDVLLKSYRELEKKMSQHKAAPHSPDEYCIDCAHGLFEADPDLNLRLHEKGFSQDQAQEVYDLAAEKLVPLVLEVAAEFQADREVERLMDHFGGPENWREVSRQLLAFGRKNLPEDVLDGLAASYEGVMALYKMMKAAGETPSMAAKTESATMGESEAELYSLMRSPKYWRDKDPATVRKVTQGFESLYRK